jgi:hypothetical protein
VVPVENFLGLTLLQYFLAPKACRRPRILLHDRKVWHPQFGRVLARVFILVAVMPSLQSAQPKEFQAISVQTSTMRSLFFGARFPV